LTQYSLKALTDRGRERAFYSYRSLAQFRVGSSHTLLEVALASAGG